MKHECRLAVRSYECDANGHVNNAVYLNYLEVARVSFLKAIGVSYRELKAQGFGLVVVRIGIDFRGEAFMDDPLVVVTEPLKKRLTGGVFRQRIFREQTPDPQLIAEAEVGWICVDRSKKPVRLPPCLDRSELEP